MSFLDLPPASPCWRSERADNTERQMQRKWAHVGWSQASTQGRSLSSRVGINPREGHVIRSLPPGKIAEIHPSLPWPFSSPNPLVYPHCKRLWEAGGSGLTVLSPGVAHPPHSQRSEDSLGLVSRGPSLHTYISAWLTDTIAQVIRPGMISACQPCFWLTSF